MAFFSKRNVTANGLLIFIKYYIYYKKRIYNKSLTLSKPLSLALSKPFSFLQTKRVIYEYVAHVTTRKQMVFYVATWNHQPHIDETELKYQLCLMKKVTGHG